MSMGFYTSQITFGSFLYSISVIGWILKKAESKKGKYKLLSKVGDCSYGIFYIHMAVLMLTGKGIQNENWYISWNVRFVLTSMISFIVVLVGQKMLKSRKIVRCIGFI